MVGGIIIILFSISSVLALVHSSIAAAVVTSIGFGVIFVAAIIIVSLACRLPADFFIDMMVVPFIVIIIVIVGVHMYSERKRIGNMT
jgi:hypothetical protein